MGHPVTTPAREVLTVIEDGTERSGIIVYALMPASNTRVIAFPKQFWANAAVHPLRLHGDVWEICRWDLVLDRWPLKEEWVEVIRGTLQELLDQGSVVSWIGAEGLPFADPPNLFSPDWMEGGVLAAMAGDGYFLCPLDPELPLKSLSPDDLIVLRSVAKGLADASE